MNANHARLISCIRIRYHWSDRRILLDLFTELADPVAVPKILEGIKARTAGREPAPLQTQAVQVAYGGRLRAGGSFARYNRQLAVCRKARRQARHAISYPRHPSRGDTLRVAGIKLGNHFPFEQGVERFGFGRVPGIMRDLPQFGIKLPSHFVGGMIPRPEQIQGKLSRGLKPLDFPRQ